MPISNNTVFNIAPGFRFQWEEAQNCHVLLYPEGMVKLNPTAGEILKYIDGIKTVDDILSELNTAFPDADLKDDVHQFLETAHDNGWIKHRAS